MNLESFAEATGKICSMAKFNQSPSQGQQSVKLKAKPLKGPSFEVADFAAESDIYILPDDNSHSRKKSTSQAPEMLSTTELISVVGQIWDCASRSLARFRPKASVHSDTVCQKDNVSCYLVGNDSILDLVNSRHLHVDLNLSSSFPCMVKQSLECLRLTQEISYEPCDDRFIENVSLKNRHNRSNRHDMCPKEKSVTNVGFPCLLIDRYRWMSQFSPFLKLPISSFWQSKMISESTFEASVCPCYPLPVNEVSLSSNSGTDSVGSCTDTPDLRNLPSGVSDAAVMIKRTPVSSLCSDYFLQPVEDTLSAANMSTPSSLGLHEDCSTSGCSCEPNRHEVEDDELLENKMRQCEKLDTQAVLQSESCTPVTDKPLALLAKQEHAVSGALAGIIVSLCLHPIDTVKTIVQSCRVDQTSHRYISQSIISERGLTGLYRGISSNITTSAPISAIYTFTYESVKGILVPSLSKEYHSVAHCTAGACASIATSFIFTPSERIKQQMQVHSHYKNCWNAVYRIIEKGGILSLYTGWGAVLCRNIPHSIIKFYTYESLKQMFMSSQQSLNQPTTLHTLVCGGLAGSTAALFSTPFDVVKTRLQTQMPGSVRRYGCILDAFQEICEHEGVKGLYRGLIPRLVMYMSQGALFFASYEFFKSVFFVQTSQNKPEKPKYKQETDDHPLLSL